MAVSIDVFLPHIMPSVIGCPDFSARSAVIEAAIEFCTDAHAWTETLDLVYLSQSTHSYELDLPRDSRAVLIKNVWAESRELTPKTLNEIARLIPAWQSERGTPIYFNQQNWDEFRVYPIPNSPDSAALTVRAVLAPTRTATTLSDFLADRYLQAIVSGALARLMLLPRQAWTDPQLASFHKSEFRLACGNAKAEMFHDRVAGNARVAPRRFGG